MERKNNELLYFNSQVLVALLRVCVIFKSLTKYAVGKGSKRYYTIGHCYWPQQVQV